MIKIDRHRDWQTEEHKTSLIRGYTAEGGGGWGGVRRSWQMARRQCDRACQNENLLLVKLQIAFLQCPPHCFCITYVLRKRVRDMQGEERARKIESMNP